MEGEANNDVPRLNDDDSNSDRSIISITSEERAIESAQVSFNGLNLRLLDALAELRALVLIAWGRRTRASLARLERVALQIVDLTRQLQNIDNLPYEETDSDTDSNSNNDESP